MRICSTAAMREMDRRAIEEFDIPGELLMENAAGAVYQVLRDEFGFPRKRYAVVCGPGNNGGDGLAVARMLHSAGVDTTVYLLADPETYHDAAALNHRILSKLPVPVVRIGAGSPFGGLFDGFDVIVDALLGTGLTRDVTGPYAACIGAMNGARARRLSVDIPSGVDGDTGAVRGDAVRADATVTFGLPKTGNLLYPGYERCGRLFLSRISFPAALYDGEGIDFRMSLPERLPPRRPDGHKGTFGDVLFIAGAAGYYGAPYLAAYSFLRAGGGYSRLAAPRPVVGVIASRAPEIVYIPMAETEEGSLSSSNLDRLLELSGTTDMTVVGPGLSRAAETMDLVRELLPSIDAPVLVDGDALTAVSEDMGVLKRRRGPTILTPHPGELARLAGLSVAEVTAALPRTAGSLAEETGCIVVAKGAHSLVAFPDGGLRMNPSGNAGMATPGSGDVLAGTIPALFGLGLPIADAVTAGVFIHGYAGDLAAAEVGRDGMTAEDISRCLPRAVRLIRERYEEITADWYGTITLR